MNEQHFIAAMQKALRGLPAQGREDILNRYRGYFAEAREQGKTDEETARILGDPRTIARSFLAHFHIQQIEQPPAGQKPHKVLYHILRAVLLICSILIFNFIFMLWPVVLIAAILLALWLLCLLFIFAAGLSFLALASGTLKALLLSSINAKLTMIFYSLAACSGGLVMLGVLFFLTRVFLLSMIQYIGANIKMVKPRS